MATVAILTENGFEQSELVEPKKALENAGHEVHVISPRRGSVRAWDHDHWGIDVTVDKHVTEVTADEYDMLILPGGVFNPDKLRTDVDALEFIRDFFKDNKPVAAICHGAQTLIDAGVVKGRKLTSYASIKVDLLNAGTEWVDEEVVTDSNLVTSRKPADLSAFNKAILSQLASETNYAADRAEPTAGTTTT
jgi:protease I